MFDRSSSIPSKDWSISKIRFWLFSIFRLPSAIAESSCSWRWLVSSHSRCKRALVSIRFFCFSVASVNETRWASNFSAVESSWVCSPWIRSCKSPVFISISDRSFSRDEILSTAVLSLTFDVLISSRILSESCESCETDCCIRRSSSWWCSSSLLPLSNENSSLRDSSSLDSCSAFKDSYSFLRLSNSNSSFLIFSLNSRAYFSTSLISCCRCKKPSDPDWTVPMLTEAFDRRIPDEESISIGASGQFFPNSFQNFVSSSSK